MFTYVSLNLHHMIGLWHLARGSTPIYGFVGKVFLLESKGICHVLQLRNHHHRSAWGCCTRWHAADFHCMKRCSDNRAASPHLLRSASVPAVPIHFPLCVSSFWQGCGTWSHTSNCHQQQEIRCS